MPYDKTEKITLENLSTISIECRNKNFSISNYYSMKMENILLAVSYKKFSRKLNLKKKLCSNWAFNDRREFDGFPILHRKDIHVVE
jgi:hypothetical protein